METLYSWDLHQLRHTAISVRAAHDYTEVDLKPLSGHTSLRSLERYIADNREAAKRQARLGTSSELERNHRATNRRDRLMEEIVEALAHHPILSMVDAEDA